MSQRFLTDPAGAGRGYPVIGNSSEVFVHANPVYIDADGFLANLADASVGVYGYYVGQGETMASDNETVAKVCPDYVYARGVEMVFGADQACTQTDVGTLCDFGTYTSGAFELDLAGAQSNEATMFILGFDPQGDGTTTDVVVIAATIQGSGYAVV